MDASGPNAPVAEREATSVQRYFQTQKWTVLINFVWSLCRNYYYALTRPLASVRNTQLSTYPQAGSGRGDCPLQAVQAHLHTERSPVWDRITRWYKSTCVNQNVTSSAMSLWVELMTKYARYWRTSFHDATSASKYAARDSRSCRIGGLDGSGRWNSSAYLTYIRGPARFGSEGTN